MNDTQHQPNERESGPDFLILASLAESPKHIGAMIEDIDRLAGVRLRQDTLYGAITRLAQRGIVEPLVTSDPLQPYRLTWAGFKIAHAKFTRLASMADKEEFRGCKRLPLLFRPGEHISDPVFGPYDAPPSCLSPTVPDDTSPHSG